jgi:hypothetical protein
MFKENSNFKFDLSSNYIAIFIIVVSIICSESVNKFYLNLTANSNYSNKEFEESDTQTINYLPIILFTAPILYLMYNDYNLKGDNWELEIGITKIIPERLYNYILRIAGVYGLIQVLAQDIGIKTGLNQRNFVQNPIVSFFVLFGSAYSFTGFRGEAMFGTLIYLVLKYNSSFNKLSGVCFESV